VAVNLAYTQVSKLKNQAGNEFTGRMEAMFNDMRVSIDTNSDFREYCANSNEAGGGGSEEAGARKDGGVELTAHVLTTGCWPSISAKQEVHRRPSLCACASVPISLTLPVSPSTCLSLCLSA
jgi:hypothetical protein